MGLMDLREVLEHLSPDSLDYQEWCNVGMALKSEGYDFSVWDNWSSKGSKYNPYEMESKWESFKEESNDVVSGGTIYHYAREKGNLQKNSKKNVVYYDWDDEVGDSDVAIIDKDSDKFKYLEEIKAPSNNNFSPFGEVERYINLLFDDEDYISFVNESKKIDGKEKWIPANKGYCKQKKEIIEGLKKYKHLDIGYVFGDYDKNAGMWIRFNPVEIGGSSDKDVTDFRYALVECDDISIEKQYALIKELQLPVKVLVHSGGKSIHAIVKINAYDRGDYNRRVKFLFDTCKANGLSIDKANKNPSRLSRLPGVVRGENKQFIIEDNLGLETFEEWEEYIKSETSKIPKIESLCDVWDDMPQLAPVLIEGILRKGHKMMISSSSKAGKTWAVIELCIAISTGTKWLDTYKCSKGKVLYINLEVDRASCFDRFKKVYTELGFDNKPQGIDIWNLRGYVSTLEKLTPTLIKFCKDNGYSLIVIDPIYKVQDGDENSAGDISKFCNNIDKIATELEASVVYVHHHSKGSQGGKNAQDRASGSGVFARDPDALLDFIQIDAESVNYELNDNETAWRIESVLREFPPVKQNEFIFSYPIHKAVEGLENAKVLDHGMKIRKENQGADKEKRNKIVQEKFEYLYDKEGVKHTQIVSLISEDCEVTKRSASDWVNEWKKTASIFEKKDGKTYIYFKEEED